MSKQPTITDDAPAALRSSASKKVPLFAFAGILIWFGYDLTGDIAQLLNYHPALGAPMFSNTYAPWKGFIWYFKYRAQNPAAFDPIMRTDMAIAVFIFGAVALVAYYAGRRKEINKEVTWKGSARFATPDEVENMNLYAGSGVVLGSFADKHKNASRVLQHDGPEHVLMVAPTGSGKGVSVVNPTLLTWMHSMVVYDLKKENWALSSRWRKEYAKNTVLRFEPACNDGTGACYNPLAEIRLFTDHDVADVQNIASIVLEHGDEGGGRRGGDTYFIDAAFGLLVGYILHTCYYQNNHKGKMASLAAVANTICDPEMNFKSMLQAMRTVKHKNGKPHPLCAREATSLLNMADSDAGKQIAGIQGTIESKLKLYMDPIIEKNISESHFKIADLMRRDEPVTLYICVSSTDKSRMKPLTKLLFTQIIRNLTQEVEFADGVSAPSYKHKLLMLIDEFPSLGKMGIMNEAIAFLRGYGIRCLLIIQDFTQLRSEEAYGREEAISANCGIHIAFTPNVFPTAEELSKKIGNTTIFTRNTSTSSPTGMFGKKAGGSSTETADSRPIMYPDEILRMPAIRVENGKPVAGDEIIMVAGNRPIYGKQILHFADPVLSKRAALGALERSDIIQVDVPATPDVYG